MPNRIPNRRVATFLQCVLAMVAAASSRPAQAGDVKDANALYDHIQPERRSDLVLLPLLGKMAPPPARVGTMEAAALIQPGMSGWDEASAWAAGAPQQAVVEALRKVTVEQDHRKAYAFGQAYGIEGVDPGLVRLGLYTELGDPALLAAARFQYLPALDRLACLANVEATRLWSEKKGGDALKLLTSFTYFSRSMCDREFGREATWGFEHLRFSLERIRDLLYVDSRASAHSIQASEIHELLDKLDLEKPEKAYLDPDQIRFPQGDRIAFEQLVDQIFNASGEPDDAAFGALLARLHSSDRPLRLFSEAGRCSQASGGHADKSTTLRRGLSVFGDWQFRWGLAWFDKQMSRVLEYRGLDGSKFAAVRAGLPDLYPLILRRHEVRLELIGTRLAAGLCGAQLERGSIPPMVQAARPAWVVDLGIDPLNAEVRNGAKPTLQYLIPPKAGHDVQIILPNEVSFHVLLKNDVFVLYSVGSDYQDQKAKIVQNTVGKVKLQADYLLWPPVFSLYRQSQVDLGELK